MKFRLFCSPYREFSVDNDPIMLTLVAQTICGYKLTLAPTKLPAVMN